MGFGGCRLEGGVYVTGGPACAAQLGNDHSRQRRCRTTATMRQAINPAFQSSRLPPARLAVCCRASKGFGAPAKRKAPTAAEPPEPCPCESGKAYKVSGWLHTYPLIAAMVDSSAAALHRPPGSSAPSCGPPLPPPPRQSAHCNFAATAQLTCNARAACPLTATELLRQVPPRRGGAAVRRGHAARSLFRIRVGPRMLLPSTFSRAASLYLQPCCFLRVSIHAHAVL